MNSIRETQKFWTWIDSRCVCVRASGTDWPGTPKGYKLSRYINVLREHNVTNRFSKQSYTCRTTQVREITAPSNRKPYTDVRQSGQVRDIACLFLMTMHLANLGGGGEELFKMKMETRNHLISRKQNKRVTEKGKLKYILLFKQHRITVTDIQE